MGKDFEVVSKDQWQIFESQFSVPGVPVCPIRRINEKLGVGIKTFPDLYYQKVN